MLMILKHSSEIKKRNVLRRRLASVLSQCSSGHAHFNKTRSERSFIHFNAYLYTWKCNEICSYCPSPHSLSSLVYMEVSFSETGNPLLYLTLGPPPSMLENQGFDFSERGIHLDSDVTCLKDLGTLFA